ncbi:Phosphatidylinositol transfer protein sfh5 [Penicillium odoratum]|uniref:Phosphatidylinositol transfer protein sfh5 n=1 Tax=Penicillium odoratum TaxID=1167516 RepID=UPI00254950E7|nr:Phosphatidylinositol transfer protein sfh5 [Penicillium odoratum]KAJ5759811.1 Phosphatidylinositol transfer protein sfh5 [Penicillium odoratum]
MSDPKPVEQAPIAEPEKLETVEIADKLEETPAAPATENINTEEAPKEDASKTAEEPTTAEPAKEEPVREELAQDAPAATTEPEAAKPEENKPAYLTNIPSLAQFFEHLPSIVSKTGHSEMWGVPLKDSEDIPTANVLIKFLRANEGNLSAAEEQLRKALEWRKETNPLELIQSGKYSASKYGGLGYLTTYDQDGRPLVFTWNIYGAVKDMSATFSDSDEFVKWRAALMELAVQDLNMKNATAVIDYDGEKDPYQMIQVHDYLNVKFFRMDPAVRTATKKTIEVFSTAYPELLREKYFVNVPAIMGWMFSAMKLILSRNTTRKFHPISNGANLAREFPASIADKLPKVYGGKGPELKDEARSVPLVEVELPKEESQPVKAAPEATSEAAPVAAAVEAPAKEEAAKEEVKEEAKEEAKEETMEDTKEETKKETKEETKEETKTTTEGEAS